MNKLPTEKRTHILGMMVEGESIRAITRLTGASKTLWEITDIVRIVDQWEANQNIISN